MKKILALCLAIFFSVSIMAGCGNNNKDNQVKQETKISTEQQASFNTQGNDKKISISESGTYTDKEHVAAYINEFAKLPSNYITKQEAKRLGWKSKGSLDKVAPGKSIGGDRYGNYEGKLPKAKGRMWKECDIDYVSGNRNAKRIVYSNDGNIYYTDDHYKTFEHLYGDDQWRKSLLTLAPITM